MMLIQYSKKLNNMQTAVQQLIELLAHNNIIDHKALSSNKRLYNLYKRLIEQSNKMFKQQIIDAYKTGLICPYNSNYFWTPQKETTKSDQYYDDTYGNNKSNKKRTKEIHY